MILAILCTGIFEAVDFSHGFTVRIFLLGREMHRKVKMKAWAMMKTK